MRSFVKELLMANRPFHSSPRPTLFLISCL